MDQNVINFINKKANVIGAQDELLRRAADLLEELQYEVSLDLAILQAIEKWLQDNEEFNKSLD